jgi:NADH-quinone oxidoreductase subunit N
MITLLHSVRAFLSGDGALILPELELLLFAGGIILIDRWLAAHEKHWNAILALGGTAFSAFTLYVQRGKIVALRDANPDAPGLLGMRESVLVDPFFLYFAILFLVATALIVLLSMSSKQNDSQNSGDSYALLLAGCAGMMLIVSGVNVIAILLGIEGMAVSCFLLVRRGAEAGRAARSYAALWGCSSVALALGCLLLYGQFQTANLGRIGAILDLRVENGVALGGLNTWHAWLALGLIAAGILLLTEAAPLQWFAPDVYEFAPTPVAAYLGAAAKTAGWALLLRLFSFLYLFAHEKWIHVWGGVAITSLAWGTIAAIRTKNVLRLLAYGAVAQTGFMLLGLVAGNENGFHGMMFYAGTYAFSVVGAFGVLVVVERQGTRALQLSDLHGLWWRNRVATLVLLVFAMSLAGLPATAGFVAKLYIVKGLIEAPHPELAAFAVVSAAAAVYYYGRIALTAFKRPAAADAARETTPLTIGYAESVALTVAVFVSLAAGLYPEPFLRMARYAFGQ